MTRPGHPGRDVRQSLVCEDQTILELSGHGFDGLDEHHQGSLLLGKEPA